jgi:UrcA family protein
LCAHDLLACDFNKASLIIHGALMRGDHLSRAAERAALFPPAVVLSRRNSSMSTIRMFAAVSMIAATMPAFAGSDGSFRDLPRLVVSYADINLATQSGAETMLRRIFVAAKQVCGDRSGIRDIVERREIRFCVRVASANAVKDINAPMLTAAFDGRAARGYDFAIDLTR